MYRRANSDRSGNSFDPGTVQAVWEKGRVVAGYNPAHVRSDACGALIERNKYSVTDEHGTGWEIDHIVPVAAGGVDWLNNLQPLQWQNNRHKGDNHPNWSCAISAR